VSADSTVKNTSVFSIFTMLSRLFGLVRDSLKAFAFGTSNFAVAFDIAFRLPNIFRNLVAEGALSQAFLPLFQEEKTKGKTPASLASGAVLCALSVFLTLFVTSVMIFLPEIVDLVLENGVTGQLSGKIVILGRILFPYILFMSLSSIYMAIQYSYDSFGWASVGPAILNIFVIIGFSSYLFMDNQENAWNQVIAFSWITLFSALVQLAFQIRAVKKLNASPRWNFLFWKHPILKKLGLLMLPAVFGLAVQEIGQLIDLFLASLLYDRVPGAVSSLSYAHRLIHLPIGVFGVAIATASLSSLSKLAAAQKMDEYREGLSLGLLLNAMLLIPASIALILLAEPIIVILFERGEFTRESTIECAHALVFYAAGIPGYSLQKLFFSGYYARKDSKTPAIVTVIVLTANVTFSYLLMDQLLHGGLAFGSVLAAYLGTIIYGVLLVKQSYFPAFYTWAPSLAKIIIANIAFGVLLFLAKNQAQTFQYPIQLVLLIPFGSVTYFLLLKLLRCTELDLFINLLRKRTRNSD
jgi:putative peptidoglycan lipid II flippase